MLVPELVTVFLSHVANTRSAATHRQYSKQLRPFVAMFADRRFADLTPIDLDTYFAAVARFPAGHRQAGELKSGDTRRAYAVAFQVLQQFATSRKVVPAKIVDKIEKPTGHLRERIPTDAELKRLTSALPAAASLIYRALIQSGARPNELVRATIADYDQTAGKIVLKRHKTAEKTGTDRVIQVGTKLATLIAEAVGTRTTGPLFVRESGQAWRVDALSRAFRKARDAAGVPAEVCLYCARHYHATQIARKKDIRAAKDALGHSNLNTTLRYVPKNDDEQRANQDLVGNEDDEPKEETGTP